MKEREEMPRFVRLNPKTQKWIEVPVEEIFPDPSEREKYERRIRDLDEAINELWSLGGKPQESLNKEEQERLGRAKRIFDLLF